MERGLTEQQFKQIYCDNYSRLCYFAYDIIADLEVSKDIVGEVFATLWDRRDTLCADRIGGLLFISVRNKCFSHVRRNKYQRIYEEYCKSLFTDENEDYWAHIDSRIEAMTRVISQMSDRTRYILEQCYYYGRTYKDVADELGISANGIKKHMVKAFTILRQHFNVKKD